MRAEIGEQEYGGSVWQGNDRRFYTEARIIGDVVDVMRCRGFRTEQAAKRAVTRWLDSVRPRRKR